MWGSEAKSYMGWKYEFHAFRVDAYKHEIGALSFSWHRYGYTLFATTSTCASSVRPIQIISLITLFQYTDYMHVYVVMNIYIDSRSTEI
jgi:hypothetical protein